MRATECSRQKAPSAKRCIKTGHPEAVDGDLEWVRKHRAPNGALRLVMQIMSCFVIVRVRKHRAPKGALRRFCELPHGLRAAVRKHRAPKGALRHLFGAHGAGRFNGVRKHRAPKGALRLFLLLFVIRELGESESTERQKVH